MATNVPGALGGKNRSGESLTFQAIHQIVFPPVNIGSDESIDTVLAAIPLAQKTKVLRVGVTEASVSGAAVKVQVVLGTVAPARVGQTMVLATAGTQILAVPATVPAAYVGATLPAANMDVLFASGSVLTLRGSSAAGHRASSVVVSLDCIAQDEHPTSIQPFGPQSF
jgi:hypothetical protein